MVDNVCMCMELEFIDKLLLEIETQCMLYALSLTATDTAQLLRQNPEITRKKQKLKEKVAKLADVRNIIKMYCA